MIHFVGFIAIVKAGIIAYNIKRRVYVYHFFVLCDFCHPSSVTRFMKEIGEREKMKNGTKRYYAKTFAGV